MMSFTTRGSVPTSTFGQLFAGHVPKRSSSPCSVGPAVVPVFTGTQSSGPTGGAGLGQIPAELSWYCVRQPLMIALRKSAAPVPSQAMALDRLPPVRRSIVVLAESARLRLPWRPTWTVMLCVPADSAYGAPRVVVEDVSESAFTGPESSSTPL